MNPADRDAVEATCEAAERDAAAADATATFPVAALTAMRDTGLLGLTAPADHGGRGGGVTDLVEATILLGRADLSVALIFTMHCQQVMTLARHAGPRLRERVLPQVAKGAMYLASVTTSAGSGGRLQTSSSPSLRDGDLIRIDRDAPIVTGGAHADGFLITVQTAGTATPGQVDLVFAARDQLDVRMLGGWQPLGMRATESTPMRLTGAVPAWQTVGEPGGFPAIAAGLFAPLAHVGWAAAWLGTAAGALSRVVRHLRGPGRSAAGPPGELVRAHLATVRGRLDVVNALLRHTAAVLDSVGDLSAPPVQLLVNTLKVRASQECYQAVDELIDVAGLKHGYMAGSALGLERALRDLRSASLNYSNDRLTLANGSLALMDSQVHLV
ncbi:acyl-CoA dehydrogenase family protein [Actinomadura syzygii]|uniref:Acyl-CoA dehydrogenase n=1 Tax=Actinomadura syzygii TaxID=1427538 RepID=A0A5D0TYC3_9ACTN|nr:acyl-CoA dehydrogenase family protein [Actinomadura syzygii]TYC10345.1 acyl-CoA dehydrogenase [Actinomadura syzygii]